MSKDVAGVMKDCMFVGVFHRYVFEGHVLTMSKTVEHLNLEEVNFTIRVLRCTLSVFRCSASEINSG